MITCPLCEHTQAAATECEVCGRALAAAPAPAALPAAAAAPMEGFEPTASDPVAVALEVGAGSFADLEPTRHPAMEVAPVEALELEQTRAAPVDAPPLEAVPDLERSPAGLTDEERTPFPALVTCRYCRTPAAPGERLCSRCGMRLAVAPIPGPAAAAPEGTLVCGCGAPVRGARCPNCGATWA